ncbi:MAG TPA: GNAT family N-acetyltransferase [Methanofastidiosum sp.]|nr:GNAT family N-acetyltransferase [Methanofastidiosum sp.]
MIIRNCTVEDVDRVRRFVDACKPLELHTSFTYWAIFNYFSNLCFLMIEDEKLIGFISGIRSSLDKDAVYLWQIGVSKEYRGKKYASRLIDHLIKGAIFLDCNRIQVSISPENESSYNTFLKYTKEHSYNFTKIGEVKYHDTLTGKNEYEIIYQIEI